jgi:translation elongation factor EF-1beta
MADKNLDMSKLPQDVRAKLAELDLELSEGKMVAFGSTELLIA